MVQRKFCLIYSLLNFTIILLLISGCGKEQTREIKAIDIQKNKIVILRGDNTAFAKNYDTDIAIFSGSIGGIAAAISVCSSGRNVVLVVDTDKIAACFPDTSKFYESRLSEDSASKNYRIFRKKIREWYINKNLVQPKYSPEKFAGLLDYKPGDFCFEGHAAEDVINEMINSSNNRGQLTVLTRNKPVEIVWGLGGRIASLNLIDLDNKVVNQVTAWMYIDATEKGDLLPIAGIGYKIGADSRDETGEPHAADKADSSGSVKYLYYDASLINRKVKSGVYDLPLSEIKPSGSIIDSIEIVVEPRRLIAETVISEKDISAEFQKGPRAKFYKDSVGIGYSPIILSEQEIIPAKPFQIPASSLIPKGITNFIVAGPSLGATFVASKAVTSPWVHWAIGEGAGEYAVFCTGREAGIQTPLENESDMKLFHEIAVKSHRIPIYWYDNVSIDDKDFFEAQMKPFSEPGYNESAATLSYTP